jgi:hypothetical protein
MQRKSNGKLWPAGHTVWGLCAAHNHALFHSTPRAARYRAAVFARLERLGYGHGCSYSINSHGALWPMPVWRKD